MRIRNKFLIIFISIIFLFSVVFLVFFKIQMNHNSNLQEITLKQFDQSLISALKIKSSLYQKTLNDYSLWTDMANYTKAPDERWISENLLLLQKDFKLNLIGIFDKGGKQLFFNSNIGLNSSDELGLKEEFYKRAFRERNFSYFYISESGPVEIWVSTIHNTDDIGKSSEPTGVFIIGKLWDAEFISDINNLVGCEYKLENASSYDESKDENTLTMSFPLRDWNEVVQSYAVFNKNLNFVDTYVLLSRVSYFLFVLLAAVLLAISFWSFHKWFDKPVKLISKSLTDNNMKHISKLKEQKNELGLFANIVDKFYSQKQELEEAHARAEESSMLKTSLIANMSHELRTPMTGIIGFSEMLKDMLQSSEYTEVIQNILDSSRRLMRTLDSILNLSIFESGKMNIKNIKMDIMDAAEEAKSIFKQYADSYKDKNLECKFSNEGNVKVYVNRYLFSEIITNLIDNAFKFTKEGFVSVSVQTVKNKDNKRFAAIIVKDTGIGIAPEHQDMIFHEFRQVSEGYNRTFEGIGLGLSLCKKMAEFMSGKIFIRSELYTGSEFSVIFPLVIENMPISISPEPESEILSTTTEEFLSYRKGDILVVEDNQVNLDLIKVYLNEVCNIDSTRDGFSAIQMASAKKYGAILMDINLGPAMDGLKTAKEIRKIEGYEHIPIIAVTGYATEDDRKRILDEGLDYHIPKPFSKHYLVDTVKKFVYHN